MLREVKVVKPNIWMDFLVHFVTVVFEDWTTHPKEPHLITAVQCTSE